MTLLFILVALGVAIFVAYQIVNKKPSEKVEDVKPTIEVVEKVEPKVKAAKKSADVVKKPKVKKEK
jgi:hypothetical protein